MGIPAPAGVSASGVPAAGDQANAVLSGQITAIGPTAPFAFWGQFNFVLWGEQNQTLTTTANSAAATVGSAAGLAVGQSINSTHVPAGTTIGALAGTDVTLAFPPGHTNAEVVAGADAAALFMGAAWVGSIQLERSFDGGKTWLVCGIGGQGVPAVYSGAALTDGTLSATAGEPERQILYRFNCTAYSSGTINYRISATGMAATAWGIPVT